MPLLELLLRVVPQKNWKNCQKETCFLGKNIWCLCFFSSCFILLRIPNTVERTWWVLLQDPQSPLCVTSFHLVPRQLREQGSIPLFFRSVWSHLCVFSHLPKLRKEHVLWSSYLIRSRDKFLLQSWKKRTLCLRCNGKNTCFFLLQLAR